MAPKSSLFIRIVAGAYVIYLGGKLINSSLADKPDNYILYIAAGVIFALIGLYWLVGSGIKMVKKEYRDDSIMGRMNEAENGKKEETEEQETEEAGEAVKESETEAAEEAKKAERKEASENDKSVK